MLALAVVGANLLVCGAVAAVLVLMRPGPPDPVDAGADTPPVATRTPEPSQDTDYSWEGEPSGTTSSSTTPNDCEQIDGPGGMTTCIPLGWPTKDTGNEGSAQADDPAGSTKFVRFGGSPPAGPDSYTIHADYERGFAGRHTNFVSLRLEQTTLRGMPAIDWEFTYDAPEGPRHVRSVYWLAQGYEYFVYSSAPAALWPEGQQILDVMLDTATP